MGKVRGFQQNVIWEEQNNITAGIPTCPKCRAEGSPGLGAALCESRYPWGPAIKSKEAHSVIRGAVFCEYTGQKPDARIVHIAAGMSYPCNRPYRQCSETRSATRAGVASAALNSQARAATVRATVAFKALTSGSGGDSGRITEPKGKRVIWTCNSLLLGWFLPRLCIVPFVPSSQILMAPESTEDRGLIRRHCLPASLSCCLL